MWSEKHLGCFGVIVCLTVVLSLIVSFRSIALNLAHWFLVKAVARPYASTSIEDLTRAIYLGEYAGAAWNMFGHGERAQAVLLDMENTFHQAGGADEASTFNLLFSAPLSNACVMDDRTKDTLAQLDIRAPKYRTVLERGSWILEGFDLIAPEEWGERAMILLYWTSAQAYKEAKCWGRSGWRYYVSGKRTYQVGFATNLMYNGGFERDLSTLSSLPNGFRNTTEMWRKNSDYAREHYHLVEAPKATGEQSTVLVLSNSQLEKSGVTTIAKIPVQQNSLYIAGGEMKATNGGNAYWGGIWQSSQHENILEWDVAKTSESAWQYSFSVAAPPLDAEYLVPVALNLQQGSAWFDNLMIFEIPLE